MLFFTVGSGQSKLQIQSHIQFSLLPSLEQQVWVVAWGLVMGHMEWYSSLLSLVFSFFLWILLNLVGLEEGERRLEKKDKGLLLYPLDCLHISCNDCIFLYGDINAGFVSDEFIGGCTGPPYALRKGNALSISYIYSPCLCCWWEPQGLIMLPRVPSRWLIYLPTQPLGSQEFMYPCWAICFCLVVTCCSSQTPIFRILLVRDRSSVYDCICEISINTSNSPEASFILIHYGAALV